MGLLLVIAVAAAGWALTCGAWQMERQVARVGPLDERSFAHLTVVTVGTGAAYENPERRGPAIAVALGRQIALVDAGRGVAEALRMSLIPVSQPDVVYLSSLLPENTQGLDDLLINGWIQGRTAPLRLVGPEGTRTFADALLAAHARGIEARSDRIGIRTPAPAFDVTEISDDWSSETDGLRVRAAALPGGPIEAFAYRFEAGGRSAAIGGTGWAPAELVALAQGANLLIHEAIFVPTPEQAAELGLDESPDLLRKEAVLHTAIDQVGGLAERAGVETLVLVRLRPPPVFDLQITGIVGDAYGGRIVIASDGDEIRP